MSKFNINDAVFGSGEYYGFNEKQITLPYLSTGCVFNVTVNGTAISIPYSTSLSNTLSLIKTALLAVVGVGGVVTNGTNPVVISILSNVDGAVLEVENLALVCNGNSICCADINEVSPLKEKACLNVCESNTTPIDFTPVVDAIKEKKDYELVVLCDVATGNPVIQTYTFDDSGLLVQTNINPDGSLFLGSVGKCPNKNYGITSKDWFCVNGTETVSREDIVDFETNTTVGILWRDINGDVVSAPANGTFTVGVCSVSYNKIVNGEVTFLPQGGAIATTFNGNSVSDVMVTNLTPNIIEIKYSTLFPVSGNSLFYCASGQTVHINTNDINDLIQEITITDILSIGAGNIIINATRI